MHEGTRPVAAVPSHRASVTAASVAVLALALWAPVPSQAVPAPGSSGPAPSPDAVAEPARSPPAPAGAWDQVFSVASIQPRLHADGVRVVVVPAGDHPEVEPAVKALRVVLETSRRVTLARRAAPVMLTDDGEIARRVATQGYDRVVVVRTFDVDARVQAVVGVLDAEGRTIDAFIAWSDDPLAAPGGVSFGVTEDALVAVSAEHDAAPAGAEPTDAAPLSDRGRDEPARRRRTASPERTRSVRLGVGLSLIAVGSAAFAVGLPLSFASHERSGSAGAAVAPAVLGIVAVAVGIPVIASIPAAERKRRHVAKTSAATLALHPVVGPTGGAAVLEGRF